MYEGDVLINSENGQNISRLKDIMVSWFQKLEIQIRQIKKTQRKFLYRKLLVEFQNVVMIDLNQNYSFVLFLSEGNLTFYQ